MLKSALFHQMPNEFFTWVFLH